MSRHSHNAEELGSRVGKYSYGKVVSRDHIAIVHMGSFCSIASGVMAVVLNDHNPTFISSYPFRKLWGVKEALSHIERKDPHVYIGNDVWIGHSAMLCEGTNIGDGSIIGSHAVVHGEIPPYSIAVGNPARVIKKRFTEEQIYWLLQIKWWDWEDDKIREFAPLLSSPDVDAFITKAMEG